MQQRYPPNSLCHQTLLLQFQNYDFCFLASVLVNPQALFSHQPTDAPNVGATSFYIVFKYRCQSPCSESALCGFSTGLQTLTMTNNSNLQVEAGSWTFVALPSSSSIKISPEQLLKKATIKALSFVWFMWGYVAPTLTCLTDKGL